MSSPGTRARPLARIASRTAANRGLLFGLFLLTMVVVALLVLPSLVSPARAAGSTPTVFVAPSSRLVVAQGAPVNFWVNVSSMPTFNGFDILVKVDSSQLTPASISKTGIIFTSGSTSEDINCVNAGAGITLGQPGHIGCVAGLDGPGIAHERVLCLGCFSTSDHGLLFNVTFTGVAAVATGSVIDVYNDQIFKPPTPVPHVTFDGMYGVVRPDYLISASPFSQSIPQGRTGSATINLTSVNAFAGTLVLNNASIAGGTSNKLPVSFNTTSVTLTAGAMKFVGVTISPTSLTTGGVYDLILNASGGSPNLIHATDLNITITVPNFSIVANPTSLVNPMGSTNTTTLTLTSINTFTAKVNVSFTVTPVVVNGPTITLTNSSFTGRSVTVIVPNGGTVTVTLTVSSTTATASNGYAISVKGVGGGVTTTASVSVSVVPFSITASPVSVTLTNSTSGFATSTLTINNLTPSAISVDFTSALSPPASNGHPLTIFFANGTAATPSPGLFSLTESVLAGGTSLVTLNVTEVNSCFGNPVVKCTAVGTYNVKSIGTIGTASRSVIVAATVTPLVDFTIAATTPVNFNTGATGAATTVTITSLGGFTGTVTLTPTSPAGLTTTCPPSVTFPPSPQTASCTFSSATPGVYGVTITGSGGGHTHSASVTVHVGDFSIGATNPSGAAGSSISSTVTLTSLQNFVGSVALTATPPAGLTCNPFTVTPVSLTANGTGTSSLSCTSPTAGTFIVNISSAGTPGTASHPATATFTFIADFSIIATSPSDFNAGGTGSSTITITPVGGFTGTVTLTTTVSPSTGLVANCPASLMVSGASAVTVTCGPTSSTPGTYTVTITASSPGLTHTASFVSHVASASTPTVTSIALSPSGSTTIGQVVSVTVTVSNTGGVNVNFTLQVKWGSITVVQMNETLPANQQKPFSLSWDTTSYAAGANTVSAVIFNDGAWSATSTGSSYSLVAPAPPFFTSTTIAVIGGVAAAVAVLAIFLGLRLRKKTPVV